MCSYYKSGTNWTLQIAVQIAYRGRAEFEHIHDVVPWLELPARGRFALPLDDDGPRRLAPTELRVIKTHLPLEALPPRPPGRVIPGEVPAAVKELVRALREDAKAI